MPRAPVDYAQYHILERSMADVEKTRGEYEAELRTFSRLLRIAGVAGSLFLFGALVLDEDVPEEFALLLVVLGSGLLAVAGVLYAYGRGTLHLLKRLKDDPKQNDARE